MDKLTTELKRLHFDNGGPDDAVRLLVIEFLQAADWDAVATLFAAVQRELDLPAPAISVSASAGFRLWLPLAEAVSPNQAQVFLEGLRQRYLAEFPRQRLRLGREVQAEAVPAPDPNTDKWSAFIDPTMGSMFLAEPGLDMAPNRDRQADLLAGIRLIPASDFQRALASLTEAPDIQGEPAMTAAGSQPGLALSQHFDDPQHFLLAVMNDPQARAEHRIAAAQALLPYFAKAR